MRSGSWTGPRGLVSSGHVIQPKNIALGLLAVLLAAGVAVYSVRDSRKSGDGAETAGMRKAPDFEVARADGGKHSLRDWQDHVVVVHFWASWCAPTPGG